MCIKVTTESFIEKAKTIHNNKYDYSKVDYKKAREKVCIICPEHGEFWQSPNQHLSGHGCPKCSGNFMDTPYFIEKARKIHGDKYDYSKVIFEKAQKKICIICPEHGEFYQTPNHHLNGKGCPKCGRLRISNKQRKSKEEWIALFKEKHKDRFDYSLITDIPRNNVKLPIRCVKHNYLFYQDAAHHINYDNCCPICEKELRTAFKSYTLGTFIQKAQMVHGDKYDYSKVEYNGSQNKITIICPEHGEFQQIPAAHLHGAGCPKCANEYLSKINSKDKDEFIKRAIQVYGSDKYDYSKSEYRGMREKICIVCNEKDDDGKIHGEFWQIADAHLRGFCGCVKCRQKIYNLQTFIDEARKVHGDRYDYSKVEYKGNGEKVCIICPKHGEFWQDIYSHLGGAGCPFCQSSRLENELADFFHKENIDFEMQKKFSWLKYQKLDFFLPMYNIAIECQGEQHFTPVDFAGKGDEWAKQNFKEILRLDEKKKKLCEEHGVRLLYYSDLGISYPYKVIEEKKVLLDEILKR